MFYLKIFGVVELNDVWASFSSKWSFCVKSSRCKLDALFKLHFGCPSTLSSTLTLLRLVSFHMFNNCYMLSCSM